MKQLARVLVRKVCGAIDAITFGFFVGLGIIAAGALAINLERLVAGWW